jgi:hypothetical protein
MSRHAILAVVLAACGGNTEISTEGYDKSCEIANTCNVVFVGDVCGCPCEVDAISYTQQTLWAQERSRKQGRCDEVLTCQPCPEVVVECLDQTCSARLVDDES